MLTPTHFDEYFHNPRINMERQVYKDISHDDACKLGLEVIQLKYDGWWTFLEIKNGTMSFYSRTRRLFKSEPIADPTLDCCLVGEHMQGTQWSQSPDRLGKTFLFDAWRVNGQDLSLVPYADRYRILKAVHARLPSTFQLVQNYPMTSFPDLWALCDEGGGFEGLVYRMRRSVVPVCIFRNKRTFTTDLIVTDFLPGEGKYEGVLGAIRGTTPDGVTVDVGGGFEDEDRRMIWGERDFYMGKKFEVEYRKKFESGSLRHPNFKRWRLNDF